MNHLMLCSYAKKTNVALCICAIDVSTAKNPINWRHERAERRKKIVFMIMFYVCINFMLQSYWCVYDRKNCTSRDKTVKLTLFSTLTPIALCDGRCDRGGWDEKCEKDL